MGNVAEGVASPPGQVEPGLIAYSADDCSVQFRLDVAHETVWTTQQQIADAFGVSINTVREHLQNIFAEGELVASATTRNFRAVGKNGKEYNSLHYNLDAILAVGYRVSSKRATAFRRWATQVLREYATRGYVLNRGRLRRDPGAVAVGFDEVLG